MGLLPKAGTEQHPCPVPAPSKASCPLAGRKRTAFPSCPLRSILLPGGPNGLPPVIVSCGGIMDSLLTLPEDIHLPGTPEHFTALLTSDSGLLVERIVSWGHVTPEGSGTIRKKTNGSCCWKAPPGWALAMAVKYPWNAASVCYCLSMCAIVCWRPASPVSGWPSTRRSCARRKPTARPPVRRDSVAPAPFSPARG